MVAEERQPELCGRGHSPRIRRARSGTGNSAKTDARRVASVSKAVCATVLGIAAERSRQGLTPRKMTFDDPAFDFIPQAQPLSDPRKAKNTVKQLLNHTSGITPEATGARNQGRWQHVLGHDGDPLTARLAFDPGTKCGYSSFALYHASLVCENVTGKPYDEFASRPCSNRSVSNTGPSSTPTVAVATAKRATAGIRRTASRSVKIVERCL